jgi:hypothetical protein
MNCLRSLWCRFGTLGHKHRIDVDMDEEMRSHIEMQTQENIEAGTTPEQARYAALRQFGWVDSIQETAREERSITQWDGVLTIQGRSESVRVNWVTPNLLTLLGVRPVQGRLLAEGDEVNSGVLVPYGVWERLGSDPTMVGKTVKLDGELTSAVPPPSRLRLLLSGDSGMLAASNSQ